MHRLVLFSSFAFNPNLDKVLALIFPQELEHKVMGFMPANGLSEYNPGILDYWKETAKKRNAKFIIIDNNPTQTPEELEQQKAKFSEINILLVSGGDTFPMLNNLRKSGLDQYILTFWEKKTCVLAGFSAGALLMTPTININKIRPKTKNNYAKYSESQLKGLHLVNYTVYPHYDKYRNKPTLDLYRSTYETPIKALPDDHCYVEED